MDGRSKSTVAKGNDPPSRQQIRPRRFKVNEDSRKSRSIHGLASGIGVDSRMHSEPTGMCRALVRNAAGQSRDAWDATNHSTELSHSAGSSKWRRATCIVKVNKRWRSIVTKALGFPRDLGSGVSRSTR